MTAAATACGLWSTASAERLLPLARQHFGISAFRPLQREALEANLRGLDSLCIMPTGGGKSLCYQLPALAAARGLTIVVSPLIALMKDQVDRLRSRHPERSEGSPPVSAFRRFYVPSFTFINSTQHWHEQADVLRMAREGRLRLLYVSPERCMQPEFLTHLVKCNLHAFIIDEAHCIASWGHDFRPAYAQLGDLREIFPGVPIHAFTATAAERVRTQIIASLSLRVCAVPPESSFPGPPHSCGGIPPGVNAGALTVPVGAGPILIGDFDRPNLTLRVVQRDRDSDAQLVSLLKSQLSNRSGIIYCSTRLETERLAGLLRSDISNPPIDARPYHAGLSDDDRRAVQDWFMGSEPEAETPGHSEPEAETPGHSSFDNRQSAMGNSRIVVATIAFALGLDKPDVRFVIHHGMPSSLEVYHQEIGRAGRDGLPAECVLLYDRGDYHRWAELLDRHPERSEGSPPAPIASSLQPAASVDGKLDALADMECFCGVTMRNALPQCRHAHLVQYFGQTYQPAGYSLQSVGCGACDVCLSEPGAEATGCSKPHAPARGRKPRSAPLDPTPCGTPDIPLEVLQETRSL